MQMSMLQIQRFNEQYVNNSHGYKNLLQAGVTALCWASNEGHVEVVQVLLQYGASPNHRTKVLYNIYVQGNMREVTTCSA